MTNLEPIRRAIAARVFGPFREAGGLPGETSASRFDAAARAYLWNRRVRFMPAGAALAAAALSVALRSHNDRRARLWYGSAGGAAGARFRHGADVLRWIENTEAAGLRFVGWADDVKAARVDHTGWHCDDEGHETLRGGVWQLPGKAGAARLLYGYAEFEGRGEMNPGSAALCVSDVVSVPMADDWRGDLLGADETADAARWADGLAESTAEDRRDYDSAYQEGRKAAELDGEALELRTRARALAGAAKAHRRSGVGPVMESALCRTLADVLETISEKRAERDSAWADVWGDAAEAWRAGFMDESGFVRAVRLGYAKASDWRGPADANPCGAAV